MSAYMVRHSSTQTHKRKAIAYFTLTCVCITSYLECQRVRLQEIGLWTKLPPLSNSYREIYTLFLRVLQFEPVSTDDNIINKTSHQLTNKLKHFVKNQSEPKI